MKNFHTLVDNCKGKSYVFFVTYCYLMNMHIVNYMKFNDNN